MAFPTWTALTGLGGALLLSVVRSRLVSQRSVAALRAPRWKIADVVWLLALIALALITRLPGLEARAIDNDEPVGLGIGSLDGWAEDLDARLHPPLPAMLMTLAARGAIDLGAARGVSALAGVATVALAFIVARGASSRWTAIVAGILTAIAPAALVASSLARGWGLLAFSLLVAHACLTRALATGRERWWIAYTLSVMLAIFTEYVALVPLAAEAVVVVVAFRRERAIVASTLGAFGAGLVACSFLAPIALPTLRLGVGGPPHAPSGAWPALRYGADLLSGAFSPAALLLAIALVALAVRKHRLGLTAGRLSAAVFAILAALVAGGVITAVRARYALHAVPLFFIATCLAARVTRYGNAVVGAVFVAHATLLPCWYDQTCRRSELETRVSTPVIVDRVRAEPSISLAVMPSFAIAEPSWRIGRALPGRNAMRDCPAVLCAEDARRHYYGVSPNLAAVRKLLEREPRVFLLDRAEVFAGAPECFALVREAGSTLYDCGRVR